MLTPEDAAVVKTVLQEVLSRECKLAGRVNLNDIVLRSGDVRFVSLTGASLFTLRSPLAVLAGASAIVSQGLTAAKQLDLSKIHDAQELSLGIQALLPKSIVDRVEEEALQRRLIEALSRLLFSQKPADPPKLMVWGLLPNELETVYQCVKSEEVEILNAAPPQKSLTVPLLIGLTALPDLIAWADEQAELSDERPYPVLLSLLSGGEEPRGAWGSYDGVIRQDDIRQLKRWIQCPGVITAQLAANDVSPLFLRQLSQPISTLSIAEIPFGDAEWNAEQSDLRKHLRECAACRRTFNETLEARRGMPERILHQARHVGLDIAEE